MGLSLFSTAWQNLQHDWWFSPNLHESNTTTINLCFGAPNSPTLEEGFCACLLKSIREKLGGGISFSHDCMDSYSLRLMTNLLALHSILNVNYWSTGRRLLSEFFASFILHQETGKTLFVLSLFLLFLTPLRSMIGWHYHFRWFLSQDYFLKANILPFPTSENSQMVKITSCGFDWFISVQLIAHVSRSLKWTLAHGCTFKDYPELHKPFNQCKFQQKKHPNTDVLAGSEEPS